MAQFLAVEHELPSGGATRWSPQRKAMVVNAVRDGMLSLDEACRRYLLSAEEFTAWERAIEAHGVGALRVTRIQLYRDVLPRKWGNRRTPQ